MESFWSPAAPPPGKAKRKEHGAKSQDPNCFLDVFFLCLDPLVTRCLRRDSSHLITRSALASSVWVESSRQSALAAFRLITNSNFFGCSTGRSPGFGTFENLVHIGCGPPPVIKDVWRIAHETPSLNKVNCRVDSRQPMLSCQVYDPCSVGIRKWV